MSDCVDRSFLGVEHHAEIGFLHETIEIVLRQLPQKYQNVIRLAFGFNEKRESLTTAEIARVLNSSTSRINCLKCIALTQIYSKYGDLLKPYHTTTDEKSQ